MSDHYTHASNTVDMLFIYNLRNSSHFFRIINYMVCLSNNTAIYASLPAFLSALIRLFECADFRSCYSSSLLQRWRIPSPQQLSKLSPLPIPDLIIRLPEPLRREISHITEVVERTQGNLIYYILI